MSNNVEIDPRLTNQLAVLEEQPQRDPHKTARGRAVFLAQAEELAKSLPAVSAGEKRRHNMWMQKIQSLFGIHRKEHSPMFSAFSTVLLIVSLVLGGGGLTVAAAQSSQPDQGLYPVKTWSEEFRSGLASNEQARLQLAMEFANRRAEEMQAMLREGKTPPAATQTRLQAEIDLALRMAAGQSNPEALMTLERVRQQLQAHEQAFLHLGSPANSQADAVLQQTRSMLRERLQLCEDGLQDPALLRERMRDRKQNQEPVSDPGLLPPNPGPGNPWTTGTPTPGSGYGPGPGDGSGDGNPWTTGTPTPGSGYGPGPGDGSGGNGPGDGTGPGDGSGGNGPGDGSGTGDGSGGNGPGGGTGPGDGSGGNGPGGSGTGDGSGGNGPGDGGSGGNADSGGGSGDGGNGSGNGDGTGGGSGGGGGR